MSGRDASDGPTEVEATLVVASERPAEVAERMAELASLAGHPLSWRAPEELRDTYFELGDDVLGERGLALRLRRRGGERTLTLKGEPRPAPGGGVERVEVEAPWSGDGLERVLGALEARGVRPARGPSAGPGRGPVETLEEAGFRVLQRRRTTRRSARILAPEAGGGRVGSLALDTVRFRTSSERPVRHREVEVEAAPGADPALPGRLAGRLRERLGDALRPWEHSKLATGRAVAELDPPVGPDGDLLPGAYDLLERRFDEVESA